MQFSSRFGMAMHTLLIIGEGLKNQKATSELIAEKLGTSSDKVRRILGILKKGGLVSVAPRNGKGGTILAKPLSEISLFELFLIVEPNHIQDINKPTTKFAQNSYTGLYANEIFAGYVDVAIDAIKEKYERITLEDARSELIKKEAEGPYENPRELFVKS